MQSLRTRCRLIPYTYLDGLSVNQHTFILGLPYVPVRCKPDVGRMTALVQSSINMSDLFDYGRPFVECRRRFTASLYIIHVNVSLQQ